jgi:hypothetical protein
VVVLTLEPEQVPQVISILENLGPALQKTMRGPSADSNSQPTAIHMKGLGHFPFKGHKLKTQDMIKPANVGFAEFDDKDPKWHYVKCCIDMIVRELIASGIVKEGGFDNVRLDSEEGLYTIKKPHITVLGTKKGGGGREPIDMDPILEKFGDFDFGFMGFESLQLSKMDKDYTAESNVPL